MKVRMYLESRTRCREEGCKRTYRSFFQAAFDALKVKLQCFRWPAKVCRVYPPLKRWCAQNFVSFLTIAKKKLDWWHLEKMAFFWYKLNKLLLPLIVTSVFIMLKYITRNCQQFVINVSMRDHVTFFLPRFFFFFYSFRSDPRSAPKRAHPIFAYTAMQVLQGQIDDADDTKAGTASYQHCYHRVRTMSDKQLATRVSHPRRRSADGERWGHSMFHGCRLVSVCAVFAFSARSVSTHGHEHTQCPFRHAPLFMQPYVCLVDV